MRNLRYSKLILAETWRLSADAASAFRFLPRVSGKLGRCGWSLGAEIHPSGGKTAIQVASGQPIMARARSSALIPAPYTRGDAGGEGLRLALLDHQQREHERSRHIDELIVRPTRVAVGSRLLVKSQADSQQDRCCWRLPLIDGYQQAGNTVPIVAAGISLSIGLSHY